MFRAMICMTLAGFLLAAGALATPTATLTLTSTVAGQTISPGATVDWTVKVSVSTGDNFGLALIAIDLVQDASNPAKFDIPPGDTASIPGAMNGFNRPAGISNPGESGAPSGYIGVQRGTVGEKNLAQIGGGQNTFGQAGTSIGTDPVVDPGIGQPGPQIVMSGHFAAPSVQGTYTFRLQNAVANVLSAVNNPPQYSPAAAATVDLSVASLTFTVAPICRGDCNCDGVIDFDDISPFVAALGGATPCRFENVDVNADGVIDFDDISPFVEILSGGGPCP
jgi:hypothetical protein